MIDEVGYTRLTTEQAHAVCDLVTARYEQGAILLTRNTSFTEWGALLAMTYSRIPCSAAAPRCCGNCHRGGQRAHERSHRPCRTRSISRAGRFVKPRVTCFLTLVIARWTHR